MARKRQPAASTVGEIPAWFMTYSDVITLLMTFFILLLTFASQEPESFDRMKVSMFGGGGAAGFAGTMTDSLDRESIVMRHRPDTSRLTQSGSETPPMNIDPSREGADLGIKALEEQNELAEKQRVVFRATFNTIFTSDGELTSIGQTRFNMFVGQLKRNRLHLTIDVSDMKDLPTAVNMAEKMTSQPGVALGQVSVGANAMKNMVEFCITRDN